MAEPSRVRIGSCRDAAEAALIRAVLTAHDIPVYISGENHAALVGMGAIMIDQVVWVAGGDAEEASALLRELREGGAAVLADDEVPADDAADPEGEVAASGAVVRSGEDTLTRLGNHKRIALAVIVGLSLSHGTAHMTARAWKRGIALAAVQLLGWRHLFAGNSAIGGALLGGAVVVDVIGAIWVIARGTSVVPIARALPGPR